MWIKRKVVTEPVLKQKILNSILLGTNILSVDDVEIMLEKDIQTDNCITFVFVPATRQVLRVDTGRFVLEVFNI